ncbi:aminoglycoside phosphotransferase family protein [Patescibacteria group bacterium]|nr:aminoglycoside phosphotransferase family protein [Patescibacteria group bacterium]
MKINNSLALCLKTVCTDLLGLEVTSAERTSSGRNSRTYRVICDNHAQYALKLYYHDKSDFRDRLNTEFTSLQYLWQNKIRCIPRPIALDIRRNCAIYEYISGRSINSKEVTRRDIECAVQFLTELKQLSRNNSSRKLPDASEACFSIKMIIENIDQRLHKLLIFKKTGQYYAGLHRFLANEFAPLFLSVKNRCKLNCKNEDISFDDILPRADRTLSPSDFGFHNALRNDNHEIIFVDFEYFGWDDPAKTVSDFLLHPAMDIKEDLKERFVKLIFERFREIKFLRERVKIVFPLFGLKWCLILLNEYLPENLRRRKFAGDQEQDVARLLKRQLVKSKKMLCNVKKGCREFSCCK